MDDPATVAFKAVAVPAADPDFLPSTKDRGKVSKLLWSANDQKVPNSQLLTEKDAFQQFPRKDLEDQDFRGKVVNWHYGGPYSHCRAPTIVLVPSDFPIPQLLTSQYW